MNSLSVFQAIDKTTLTELVRRAVQSETVEIGKYQVSQLAGGMGNPVSLGLYRFSGLGLDRGRPVAWSLVLKAIQSPANVGETDMGEDDSHQTHWNYWRREFLIYQSGWLETLTGGLVAPRCLGLTEQVGDLAWLWLEEITDDYQGVWPLARYALAARHLGRFNGVHLAGQPLPTFPWLSTDFHHQWLTGFARDLPLFFDFRHSTLWDHPFVLRRFPAPEANGLRCVLAGRDQIAQALSHLPQTFCHRDAYPTNLMSRPGPDGEEQTVALDWGLAGIGPVGEDLAQLCFGAIMNAPDYERPQVDALLFDSYLDGLRESGWQGDRRAVRLGFTASVVVRVGIFLLLLLNDTLGVDRPVAPDPEDVDSTAEVFPQETAAARFVMQMANEAAELVL